MKTVRFCHLSLILLLTPVFFIGCSSTNKSTETQSLEEVVKSREAERAQIERRAFWRDADPKQRMTDYFAELTDLYLKAFGAMLDVDRRNPADLYVDDAYLFASVMRGEISNLERKIANIYAFLRGEMNRQESRSRAQEIIEHAEQFLATQTTVVDAVAHARLADRIQQVEKVIPVPNHDLKSWYTSRFPGLGVNASVAINLQQDNQRVIAARAKKAYQNRGRSYEAQVSQLRLQFRDFEQERDVNKCSGRVWAMTFEGGPVVGRSMRVAQAVSGHGSAATFFVLSEAGVNHSILVDQLLRQGMEIGVNTYTGRDLSRARTARLKLEVDRAAADLNSKHENVSKWFRIPNVTASADCGRAQRAIARAGMTSIGWTVDGMDWLDRNPESIASRILGQMKNHKGGVVRLHDAQEQTVKAVAIVLEATKEKFVTVGEWIKTQASGCRVARCSKN